MAKSQSDSILKMFNARLMREKGRAIAKESAGSRLLTQLQINKAKAKTLPGFVDFRVMLNK